MTKFLFHLHECGVVTPDEEGRDLPNLEAAQHIAETAARAIMCSELEDGKLCLGCHIEIENGDTGERHIVDFRDMVRITDE